MDEAYIDLTEEVERRLRQEKPVTAGELSTTFVVGWENEEGEHLVCSRTYLLFFPT